MAEGFKGKTAIVTGAALGIGRETALTLAARGAHVLVADINEGEGLATVNLIKQAGGTAEFFPCDVGVEAHLMELVNHAVAQCGRLDVMVNNAGIGGRQGPIHEMSNTNWERVLHINLTGVFWGQKYATRAMLADGLGGAIINVSSVAGVGAAPKLAAYGVAKIGVIQLTQSGAVEVASSGIRINAVCPGWTDTAILDGFAAETRQRLVHSIPMGRLGLASEIAALIAFLASDDASFITGVAYRIDGGQKS